MRILAMSLLAVTVCVLASGCAVYPGGPTPTGALVTSVRSPAQALAVSTDANVAPTKCGRASVGSFLGLFAFGDASLDAAMKDGGIKKIHHVDHKVFTFLFLWAQDTTLVYGE